MLGLDDSAREANSKFLQVVLASEYVLLIKIRNFHWNVKGEEFMMLHKMFDKMYNEVNDQADQIAERIRQLDGTPNGTMADFIKLSFLEEAKEVPNSKGMINALVSDSDKLVEELRTLVSKAEANRDFGTMDYATKWIQLHEKQLYFLRSHLG